MRMTTKFLVATLLLTLCSVVSAQDTFKEAYKSYNDQRRARNYEGAKAAAEQALKLAANDNEKVQAYVLLANSFKDLKQTDKALDTLDKALAIDGLESKSLYTVYWSLASILYSEKQYEKARDVYQKIVALDAGSDSVRVRSVIAIANTYIYSDPRDLEEARKVLETVKDLPYAQEGDKAEAQYALSNIDRLEKNYDAANKRLESIVNTPDASVNIIGKYKTAIADNYRLSSQTDKAIAAYQAILDDEKNNIVHRTRAQLMIGTTYLNAGENDKARAAYQATIDMKDGYQSYVNTAKAALARMDK